MSLLRRFRTWIDVPLHLLLFLCSLIPIVLVLIDIAQNAVAIPLADEWENAVIIAIRTAEGTLTPADIFRQYFDHRLVFSNLITAISTGLFGWNLHLALILNVVIVSISFILLVALFGQQHADGRGLALILMPFALLLFTLRQRDIWLWSGQLIGYSLTVVFLLAGVWYVRRAPISVVSAIAAGLWCVCMSLSVLQGFLGWFVIGAYLILRGYLHQPRALGAFAGIGVLALILYVSGFNFGLLGTNAAGQTQGLSTNLNSVTGYVFAFLGAPFVTIDPDNIALATFAALIGIVLTVWNGIALWRARRLGDAVIWLLLIGFAIGTAILTALGNAHSFPEPNPAQPLSGRYTPFASLFWIGVTALGVLNLRRWQTRPGQAPAPGENEDVIIPHDEVEAASPSPSIDTSISDSPILPFDESDVQPAIAAADDVLPPVDARPATESGVTTAGGDADQVDGTPFSTTQSHHDSLRGLGALVAANVAAFLIILGLYLYVVRMQPAIAPLARQTVVNCLLDFPRARNLGCMRGVTNPRLDNGTFTRRISRVAINELAAFRGVSLPYTDVIELSRLIRDAVPVRNPDGAPPRLETFDYGNGLVGLSLVTVAPTQVDFPLTIPQTNAPVFFRSAGVIDRRDLPADAPLDGVVFRIGIGQPEAEPVTLLEAPYDPTTIRAFILLEADLSAYRGQQINLMLQVSGGQQTADNVALWLDPIVEVRPVAGAVAP